MPRLPPPPPPPPPPPSFTPIFPFPERRPVVLFRYMLQTLVDRTAYTTTGFKAVRALPAFPLVLGTTKSHRGTGQGCMGDDSRHRAQILSDIPVL